MEDVVHDLYGNGQPGFIDEAKAFFARADERAKNEKAFHETRDKEIKEAIEAADKKRNDAIAERERKFNQLAVIAGLLFSAMLVMLAVLTYRDSKRAAEMPSPSPVSAVQSPHDARTPYMPPR
jgi:hypothetical protein